MSSYNSALTIEILSKKDQEQQSLWGESSSNDKNTCSKYNVASSGGAADVIPWKRTVVSVGDIITFVTHGENGDRDHDEDEKGNSNPSNAIDNDNNDRFACNISHLTQSSLTLNLNCDPSQPRFILRAAEEDGSIMEDLPMLSTAADAQSIGVNLFSLVDTVTGEVIQLVKLEEVDYESDSGSFENDSNVSSEVGSHKSNPISINPTHVNSLYSNVGSLLSFKKSSAQFLESLSTSQTSTSPPRSAGQGRPTMKYGSNSELSELEACASSDMRSRQYLRRERRSSSFTSGGSKRGKSHSGCIILIKVREPVASCDSCVDADDVGDCNAWKLIKKLIIDVDSHMRDHHSRSSSSNVTFLPTIPSEDCEGDDSVSIQKGQLNGALVGYSNIEDDAIIVDNDDEEDDEDEDDDDDDGVHDMYYYDENDEIVFEKNTPNIDLNASIDSKASEDSTSFFGDFEIS